MLKNKNQLAMGCKIAFAYVGTVVGAGFASGQEVMAFFTVYGMNSIWAIMISVLLFILAGKRILLLGMELEAISFGTLVKKVFGFFSPLIIIYLLLSMIVISTAMLAGAGALFEEFIHLPYRLGVWFTALVAIISIVFGVRGILSINAGIVPAIIAFQIIIFIFTLYNFKHSWFSTSMGYIKTQPLNLLKAGISYAAFNLLLSTGVLAPMGQEIKDKRALEIGGILGGIILGIMLLSTHLSLWTHMPHIRNHEIPILYLIEGMGPIFVVGYALILWGGIFTTLIGNLYSVTSFFFENFRVPPILSAIIGISIGIFLSSIGFSTIVNKLYPILGMIGVGFILIIIFPFYSP